MVKGLGITGNRLFGDRVQTTKLEEEEPVGERKHTLRDPRVVYFLASKRG